VQTEAGETSGAKPKRRRWKKALLRVLTPLAPPAVAWLLRILAWTLRPDFSRCAALRARWDAGDNVIVSFWHERLLLMPLLAEGIPVSILVSHHRDGEIATRALGLWGIHTVRGSSSRGAVSGFLRLVEAYRRGDTLAVIPDGPRGPCHEAKPGVIRLAKATGSTIFPISWAVSRSVRLRTWDRLIIPIPFARVAFVVGEPIDVPRSARGAELESYRRALANQLTELNRAAALRLAA
jgi:lysophospholipid acyltransferase (LPLAT)-like uncharacterized protein